MLLILKIQICTQYTENDYKWKNEYTIKSETCKKLQSLKIKLNCLSSKSNTN